MKTIKAKVTREEWKDVKYIPLYKIVATSTWVAGRVYDKKEDLQIDYPEYKDYPYFFIMEVEVPH